MSNFEMLRKSIGATVRIRPAMRQYGAEGNVLTVIDGTWALLDVDLVGRTMTIQSITVGGHAKTFGLDHYFNYSTDPEAPGDGNLHGILSLHSQLVLDGDEVKLETAPGRGQPLLHYVPAHKSESFSTKVAMLLRQERYQQQMINFENSQESIAASHADFQALARSLDERCKEASPLQAAMGPFCQMLPGPHLSLIVTAFGWWTMITWQHPSNTIMTGMLNIVVFDRQPTIHGLPIRLDSWIPPQIVHKEHWQYGLIAPNCAGWTSLEIEDLSCDSPNLADAVMHWMVDNPHPQHGQR